MNASEETSVHTGLGHDPLYFLMFSLIPCQSVLVKVTQKSATKYENKTKSMNSYLCCPADSCVSIGNNTDNFTDITIN